MTEKEFLKLHEEWTEKKKNEDPEAGVIFAKIMLGLIGNPSLYEIIKEKYLEKIMALTKSQLDKDHEVLEKDPEVLESAYEKLLNFCKLSMKVNRQAFAAMKTFTNQYPEFEERVKSEMYAHIKKEFGDSIEVVKSNFFNELLITLQKRKVDKNETVH